MYFPKLRNLKQKIKTVAQFGGLNRTAIAEEGEFSYMENLSSDDYPALGCRSGRAVYATKSCTCLAAGEALCYVNQGVLYINDYPVEIALTQGEKQLVMMDHYVLIFPDQKYVNTYDPRDMGDLAATFRNTTSVEISFAQADGRPLSGLTTGVEPPATAADGRYWFDSDGGSLYRYSATELRWLPVKDTYVRFSAAGIGKPFRVGDGVTIAGILAPELQNLNTTATIVARGDNFLVLPGIAAITAKQTADEGLIQVKREVPALDFVVLAENRLWGCHYGVDRTGNRVNMLYASKAGDFRNWYTVQGLDTDSCQLTLGATGPFTGAAVLEGQPIFFREDCLHKVVGNKPGQFRVQTRICRGVQPGSHRSLALVEGVLYYNSTDGICAYRGEFPEKISQKPGGSFHSAVAGGIGHKYYISVAEGEEHHLLVYDTRRKLWHREDDLAVTYFCTHKEKLYAATAEKILILSGTADSAERVSWMAQTAILPATDPYKRYLSKIFMRLQMESGSKIRIYARYDGKGEWVPLGAVSGTGLRSFSLPLRLRRCDFLQLQLRGEGKVRLYSLSFVKEQGGEI